MPNNAAFLYANELTSLLSAIFMKLYFGQLRRHGVKLYLGFLLGFLISTLFLLGMIWLTASFTLLTGGENFYLLFSEDPVLTAQALEGMFTDNIMGLILFVLLAPILLLPYSSFNAAGMYSSVRQAVFEERSSIGAYFTGGFRYFGKMLGQTILIALLSTPFYVLLSFFIMIIAGLLGDGPGEVILTMVFSFILLFPFILLVSLGFLHAPVILVSDQAGIWKSISLSWKLLFKKFGQVFLSLLFIMGIGLIVAIPYGIFNVIQLLLLGDGIGAAIVTDLVQLFTLPLISLLSILLLFVRYKQKLQPFLFPQGAEGKQESNPDASVQQPQPSQQEPVKLQPEKPVQPQETVQPAPAQNNDLPSPAPSTPPTQPKRETPSTPFPTFTYPDEDKHSR